MSQSFVINLPWPPSVNTYWRSLVMPVGRALKSVLQRVWIIYDAVGGLRVSSHRPSHSEATEYVPARKYRSVVLLSEEGREYRELVARAVREQRVPVHKISGKLAVWIHCMPPDRRARDLDNLPKGVLDGLKHAGVIRDDCDIDDLRVTRFGVKPGGELQIQISEIPGEATESGQLFQGENHVQESTAA